MRTLTDYGAEISIRENFAPPRRDQVIRRLIGTPRQIMMLITLQATLGLELSH
ncbi:hypothetical protein N825_22625 [Skermanella stibiiresistens SB22]|uniref:Uncharacterized protein n=1 Tax=Skermanella stibiiresistens SB22 TaxID=1385369 RepID=W9GT11_9PROT|nr:hypothetical protein N825_22625 [Skermanella stibiiresistens SB22]